MSRTQGSEITRAMEEQKELEQRFEALVTARATLRTMPNKNKLKEVGRPDFPARSESPRRKCLSFAGGCMRVLEICHMMCLRRAWP
jgi:hypothetical protein